MQLYSHFKGEDNALFGGPGSAKRHRMNGPGSLQSGGGPDADSPSGLPRSSSSPLVGGGGGPGGGVAALSPPPLAVTLGGDRWPGGGGGLRSTSMDNNAENNNKVHETECGEMRRFTAECGQDSS